MITKLIYEKDMITERDYQNIIDTAAEDGRAEGFAEGLAEGEAKGWSEGKAEGLAEGEAKGKAEGLAEGKAEERVLIAKALKKQGIQTSTIAAATGIFVDNKMRSLWSFCQSFIQSSRTDGRSDGRYGSPAGGQAHGTDRL